MVAKFMLLSVFWDIKDWNFSCRVLQIPYWLYFDLPYLYLEWYRRSWLITSEDYLVNKSIIKNCRMGYNWFPWDVKFGSNYRDDGTEQPGQPFCWQDFLDPNSWGFLLGQLWIVNYYIKCLSNNPSNEDINTGVSREIILQEIVHVGILILVWSWKIYFRLLRSNNNQKFIDKHLM